VLADTDTLMVFGLDHMVTEQEASPQEIDAVREFLKREGNVSDPWPHHDVGVLSRLGKERAMEYMPTMEILWCPASNGLANTRVQLMKGLGVPIENRMGLRLLSSRKPIRLLH